MIQTLHSEVDELQCPLAEQAQELKSDQTRLVQFEKLAAIDHLFTGIAHEINTPIQFVGDNLRACSRMFAGLHELILAYQRIVATPCVQEAAANVLPPLREMEQRLGLQHILDDGPRAFAEAVEGVDRVQKIAIALKTFSTGNRHK